MFKCPLMCLSVLILTLAATFRAAPLSGMLQLRRDGANAKRPQANAPRDATKIAAVEPDGRALCLAISPDGHTLAAGCDDGAIYLLGPLSGEKRVALSGTHRSGVRGVAFIPGGHTVASASGENRMRFWDASTGELLKAVPALSDMKPAGLPGLLPGAMAVSPDGNLIAVGGCRVADRSGMIRPGENSFFEIRVLDTKTGEPVWSQLGRRVCLHQLAFSPDGKTLAADTGDVIRLLDARKGTLKQTLKPRSGDIWAFALSPDNQRMAGYGTCELAGRTASYLTLWDVRSGAIVYSIVAGGGGAAAPGTLAFSPDGKTVASAGVDFVVGRLSIDGREAAVSQKAVNHIKLWDVATGALRWTSAAGEHGQLTSLVFSPDGLSLYCCDMSAISRIDARTGQTRRDLVRATDGRAR